MKEYDGLHALVTGGASGIGRAIADALADRGAQVTVLDRSAGDLAMPHRVVTADLSDDDAIRAAVTEAVGFGPGLDIVVNNAGIGAIGGIADNEDAEWLHVFDVNVLGTVRVTRAALPALRRSQHAAIVNTCSIAATVGLPARSVYSASKGALLSLTLSMAAELLPDGIRVNAVNPGTADTPWVQRLLASADDPEDELRSLRARQPHGRLVTADEVAHAVAYLASPLAGSTTGTWLTVDGGMEHTQRRVES